MARPANVSHVVISGLLPGGERWASGFWIDGGSSSYNAATLPGIVADTSFTAWLTAMRAWLSTPSNVNQADLYVYDSPSTGAVAHYTASLGNLSGTGGASAPNQVAVVMTLRSDLGTARGRGRMYLPANGQATPAGLFASSNTQALVTATANMLSDVDSVIVSVTGGLTSDINEVDADVIPDTQRRRRDALRATRLTAPVV